MQKENVFIEGQTETITLPMLITTSKTSEVLVGPFLFLYLKANNKMKLFLVAMSGSVEVKKTHGKFQTKRVPLT